MNIRHSQLGMGLFDALIAMVILSFGMLAMTRFQSRLVGEATEAQTRLTATALADELLNTAMVDTGASGINVSCYTLPPQGACAAPSAASRAQDWASRVAAALPGATASSVLAPATGQMTVTIQWTGKSTGDTRTVEVISDVR